VKHTPDPALLPLTVPEVRRLLWRLALGRRARADHVLRWSRWRRRHQARAKQCHWRKRLARAQIEVRL
jgi:hypothetical protein